MAGIGFQLERMVRDGGVGGFVGATLDGAVLSSGPWITTIGAVLLLQIWLGHHVPASSEVVLTVMIYAFSASVVIASPCALVGVRIAAGRMFDNDRDAVPGILILTLCAATGAALVAGHVLFGVLSHHAPGTVLLATAIVVLLTQISVTGPFLTAVRRPWPVLLGYLGGIAAAAVALTAVRMRGETGVLAAVAIGMGVTLILILAAFAGEFPASAPPRQAVRDMTVPTLHVAVVGLMNALALWIDKWLLWFAPDSIATVDRLRVNPIYDQASFAGLLTLIPGLSLMLFLSETRLERAFLRLVHCCTGTAKLSRIEDAQREVVTTIVQNLRLLVVTQTVFCAICWVLAPELFAALGFDARGIFAFRFTVLGVIFHIVAIYAGVVLSYYDLFGRIGLAWAAFFVVSAAATLISWHSGFVGYGLGYLLGAAAGATVALVLMTTASADIVYLLFVGNNPSVVGERRYLV
ncbi:MAG: hypothetical protein RIS94_948 [Pseudomonadota bacterium]|jgi:uncharacterized membrane protein